MSRQPVRHGHGGKRDGAGRPKGALNIITRPVKELAAEQSEASINRLIELRDHAESEQVRLAAAMAILDRAHGKPRQVVDLQDERVVVVLHPNVDEECPPDVPATTPES